MLGPKMGDIDAENLLNVNSGPSQGPIYLLCSRRIDSTGRCRPGMRPPFRKATDSKSSPSAPPTEA